MSAPVTLKSFYKELIVRLSIPTIDTPELDARFIIEERTPFTWSDIISNPDALIDTSQHQAMLSDVERRLKGKPLSRIYGQREFWGLPFEISPHTLDPRPDTELIIELSLKRLETSKTGQVLDLGTGSGCVLISFLTEFQNFTGYGVDISEQAIAVAKRNATKNQCEKRARFICGSWLDSIQGKFDVIVSNPPYIANQVIGNLEVDVRSYDPILALDGGDDGLQPYKVLFPKIKNFLKPNGIALFEIGYDQEDDVMRLAEDSGFALRTVHTDWAGNPRVVEISCGDK